MDPFDYVPPTPETAPRYAAINAAADEATVALSAILLTDANDGAGAWRGDHMAHHDLSAAYADIRRVTKALYDVIREQAPACADRSAAERCCRLARMAANHSLSQGHTGGSLSSQTAFEQILLARWQACAAVALGGA